MEHSNDEQRISMDKGEHIETVKTQNTCESVIEQETQAISKNINSPSYKYVFFAGFWIRFWAYIVDLIVVGSLNRILIYPAFRWADIPLDDTSMLSLVGVSTAFVMYLYFILMTKIFGQTLGKMIFGLKVIQKNEHQLTWSSVIFREFIGKFISKTVFFVGFILIAFMPQKQGLHDWFADTLVIQERRGLLLSNPNINMN